MSARNIERKHAQPEEDRLSALHALNLLDTPTDPDMDHLVSNLMDILKFPVGFVSLVDRDRQWFKSIHGMNLTEMPRQIAICDHTILDDVPLVIEDLTLDARFSQNPVVTAEPHLRAYAGTPIRTSGGHRIGTVCVADTQPRRITETDTSVLTRFASIIERLILSIEASQMAESHQDRISAARAQVQNLREQCERVESTLHAGHWCLDLETEEVIWSRGVFDLHGLAVQREPSLAEALAFYPEEDRKRIEDSLAATRETGRPFDLQASFTDAGGRPRWVRVRGEKSVTENGTPCIAGVFQDISDLHDIQSSLAAANSTDPVTGVPNSQCFEKELAHWIRESGGKTFALIEIGIPSISVVRHSYGMSLTDIMLREIARELRSALGDGEFLARTSYEGFSILTRERPRPELLRKRLTRTLAILNRKVAILNRRIDIEPRCAVAFHPADGTSASRLLRSADLALRVAYDDASPDASGIVFFESEMAARFEVRENAAGFLQSAIDEDRVTAFFQPIVSLESGRVDGFEALVRVRMPDGSFSGPLEFWPALLEPGISRELGFIMRDAVIQRLGEWQKMSGRTPRISLNAATSDLGEAGMQADLVERLKAANIAPGLLKIEVTENVLLTNQGTGAGARVAKLRAQGVLISLDDFGTGYGSLTNLLSLSADEVKIDKSFVNGLETDQDSRAITSSILSMAREMNMTTVSEGIETVAQLDFVRSQGSTHAQGFLIAEPMQASQATALLRKGAIDLSFSST
ncbi:EAL domain-containing protein [Minwuia sp.]|uniref:EAL domain-containing protein n=1 Tax=Minwuia sp. TaxID=2493630 RepID=UPI003A92EF13